MAFENERDICLKHADSHHCWHVNGQTGFSGNCKTVTPVKCCHCKQTAERVLYQPASHIVYPPLTTFKPKGVE